MRTLGPAFRTLNARVLILLALIRHGSSLRPLPVMSRAASQPRVRDQNTTKDPIGA
jgi:hypothetical protein